jgi:predicted TIM-barrel fold metal-dependent hydrolase
MMWGSDYPHSESTFPQSRKILAEILAGVPDDERARIVGGNTARVYGFDVADQYITSPPFGDRVAPT